MRMHRALCALAATLLASCGDYGAPDEVLYGEAVFTQPKPGTDFTQFGTYFLSPDYVHFEGDSEVPVRDPLPDSLRTSIDNNMQRLGYTAATSIVEADVQLGVAVLDGTSAVYYPGYWCDYWYYYSCYYDWYYAGSYKYGTAVLSMTDVRAAPPEGERVPSIWTAGVYGVASTPTYDIQRVVDGFNRAFEKSPYLATP
jgi:Domain of unknown function (DUF4136)